MDIEEITITHEFSNMETLSTQRRTRACAPTFTHIIIVTYTHARMREGEREGGEGGREGRGGREGGEGCPNHLNLFSFRNSAIGYMCASFQMSTFLT